MNKTVGYYLLSIIVVLENFTNTATAFSSLDKLANHLFLILICVLTFFFSNCWTSLFFYCLYLQYQDAQLFALLFHTLSN